MTKIKVIQKSINCIVYIINILVVRGFLKYALSILISPMLLEKALCKFKLLSFKFHLLKIWFQ